jgi:hypothetical protein
MPDKESITNMEHKPKSTSGRGKNPNSLKNLKPCPKGKVLNPHGGRAHSAIRRLTNEYFKEIIEAALLGNIEGLAVIINDPASPALKVGVAKSLHTAIKNGNWLILESIIARLLGKLPDKLEVSGAMRTGEIKELSEQELKERVEKKYKNVQALDE